MAAPRLRWQHAALFVATLAQAQHVLDPGAEQRRLREHQGHQEQLQQTQQIQQHAPAPLLDSKPVEPTRLPASESPCFTIAKIELHGDASRPFGWVLEALSGPGHDDHPVGRCLGAQGVRRVLKRAQDAILAEGFVTTRVLLQAQALQGGTLTLEVIPGRVHEIRFVESAAKISPADTPTDFTPTTPSSPVSVRTAVPIQPADILNLHDIEQALENFKRIPTVYADIQIAPATDTLQLDASDLLITWQQDKQWRAAFTLDDSGSPATGVYQGSSTLSWDNPLGLSDMLYFTRSHSVGDADPGNAALQGTQGSTWHYALPLGYWSLGATLSSSRYFQTVAGINQSYVYSGSSGKAEVKLSRLFFRSATQKATFYGSAFEQDANSYVNETEIAVQKRREGGWMLGADCKSEFGSTTLDANVNYRIGTPDFHSLEAPENTFGQGTSRFGLWQVDATLAHTLAHPFTHLSASTALRYRYNLSLRAQGNDTPLSSMDRLCIGSRLTVRGFDGKSTLCGDSGWFVRQDMGLSLDESALEIYLGIDAGGVDGQSTSQIPDKTMTGAVIGLRNAVRRWQYDLFVGAPLYQPNGFSTDSTTAGFNFSLTF